MPINSPSAVTSAPPSAVIARRRSKRSLRVDLPAVGAVPWAAGERDDSERGDDVAFSSPDRDGKMARPQLGCDAAAIAPRLAAEAQHRDVGRGIASGERRLDAASVGERQREIGVALDGLLGGDDEAGLPDDAARGKPAAAVHGDDRRGCRVDGGLRDRRENCERASAIGSSMSGWQMVMVRCIV